LQAEFAKTNIEQEDNRRGKNAADNITHQVPFIPWDSFQKTITCLFDYRSNFYFETPPLKFPNKHFSQEYAEHISKITETISLII
jgi:hypothetical protein